SRERDCRALPDAKDAGVNPGAGRTGGAAPRSTAMAGGSIFSLFLPDPGRSRAGAVSGTSLARAAARRVGVEVAGKLGVEAARVGGDAHPEFVHQLALAALEKMLEPRKVALLGGLGHQRLECLLV